MLSSLIHNWLLGGADPTVGLRLFMDYTDPKPAVAKMVSKHPERHLQIIKVALYAKAGMPYDFHIPQSVQVKNEPTNRQSHQVNKAQQYQLRTQWPFLADNDCPPELKLLISDKITAYRNCIQAYDSLSDCNDHKALLSKLSSLVNNFIDNHKIYKELKHYKDNRKILGDHKIFGQFQRIRELRNLKSIDLFKKKKNIEHAIWRNTSQIKKDKRSDLLQQREEKIKELQMQLAEVNRLLE